MARITPSALALLLVAGAMLVVHADMDKGHGEVPDNASPSTVVAFHKAKSGTTYQKAPGAKNVKVTYWFSGTTWAPKDSMQDLTGSGLWKLSLYASETSGNFGTPDHEQVLSAEESGASLSGGTVSVKGDPVVLSGMGGCPGDKSYVCYVFGKGDNPAPDFELANRVSSCLKLPLTCEGPGAQ